MLGSDIRILLNTMAAWDFTDIYTLSPRACSPQALGVKSLAAMVYIICYAL